MAFRPNWYDENGPRTSFGRSLQDWSAFKLIAVATLGVFVLQMVFQTAGIGLSAWFGLHAWYATADGVTFNYLFPVQLVTYMLLHAGTSHILWNMFFLWMFGRELEGIMGRASFLRMYVAGGVFGGLCQWALALVEGSPGSTIGASGAVYTVMALYACKWPRRQILLLIPPMPVPAALLIGLKVFFDIQGAMQPGSNTAHLAHLGGALVGVLWFKRGDVVQQVQMKRRREKAQKDAEAHSGERREMDRILAKIQASGLGSLDKSERSFLDKRSRELRQKTGR